jgi:hypothetical protein
MRNYKQLVKVKYSVKNKQQQQFKYGVSILERESYSVFRRKLTRLISFV